MTVLDMLRIFFSFLFFLTSVTSNTGIFMGNGSRIMPLKSKDVQLKEENVHFKFVIPKNSGKWGIGFIPRVHVNALFHTVNTTNKKIDLKLGFPLSINNHVNKEFLGELDFLANSNDKKIHVTHQKKTKEYSDLFLWQEGYDAQQEKKIHVQYNINMSPNGGASIDLFKKDKSLTTIPVLDLSFTYVTKTANTWSPPLEKGEFTANFHDIMETFNEDPFSIFDKCHGDKTPYKIKRPLIFFSATPGYVKKDKNTLFWHFKDKIDVETINIGFWVAYLPVTLDELKSIFDVKWDKYTLEHIRMIYEMAKDHTLFSDDNKDLPVILKFLTEKIKKYA